MKKILTLISILVVVTLFAGCSLLPSIAPVEDSVSSDPATDLFNYSGLDYSEGEVLVKVQVMGQLESLTKDGAVLIKEWPEIGWALFSVPAGETTISYIEKLRKESGIILAQPNLKYKIDPIDSSKAYDPSMGDSVTPAAISPAPAYGFQWGFQNINAEAAWDITTGSPNVVVAVVDTGVEVTHPEFVGKTFIGTFDATTGLFGDENMYDYNGHGTHVAGIAADDGRTGEIAGVAWDCPIMPVRVEDDDGAIYTNYLIDAMLYLAEWATNNPDYRVVANMSIGGRGYNFVFKDAIDTAWDAGVLLVTSAGNDSKRIIGYPSAYNGVVTVAASTPWDVRADFSTQGWWNSVAAPGVEILSTYTGSIYEYLQGTSMASPYVCGAAALLLSHDPSLTPIQVKNQIEMTARGEGFNEQLGHGILDVQALLGPIEPMQYGSLDVMTDIISPADAFYGTGVVSIVDSMGNIAGFGTTGTSGDYKFQALKPETYTVTVSYYNMFSGEFEVQTGNIAVTVGMDSQIIFDFQVPTSITKVSAYSETDIYQEDGIYEVPMTVVAEGLIFEFVTSESNPDYRDTEMYLYHRVDGEKHLIAYNDDFMDTYSYIVMPLPAGDYDVVIRDFGVDEPLYCNFDINVLEITY